jgi:hypothetical protein
MAILTRIGLRGGRARVARWFVVALLAFASGTRGAAPASPANEYGLKAVFLYNFAQFVEWPARAFADRTTPLTIGVLGDDPFGGYLDELVRGEHVAGHPITVRRYREPEEIGDCHILFVCGSEANRLAKIIATLQRRSILTVGDAENFSRAGGMVRFVTESGKIRMRINVDAARESGLTISSKILRAATIVTKEKG